jgi:hypothetical protein
MDFTAAIPVDVRVLRDSLMTKMLFGLLAVAAFAQQPGGEWVKYSATYTETSVVTHPSGQKETTQTTGEEIRSSDGSVLTTVTVNGERVSAKLWQACGQIIHLDYVKKNAAFGAQAPRRHPYQPPDAPLGIITIAGVSFTGYPIHMSRGSGTLWIDMNDDIMGKLEHHAPTGDGGRHDVVRQLTSIDLNATIDSSIMNVPSGFIKTMPQNGVPVGCPH